MAAQVRHIDLVAYGFRNSGTLVEYTNKGFDLLLPKGYLTYYWKINEGLIVMVGTSLN